MKLVICFFIENGANADMNALVGNEHFNGNAIATANGGALDENEFGIDGTIASANMNASVEDEIGSGNAITNANMTALVEHGDSVGNESHDTSSDSVIFVGIVHDNSDEKKIDQKSVDDDSKTDVSALCKGVGAMNFGDGKCCLFECVFSSN